MKAQKALIVRFRSKLPHDECRKIAEQRKAEFQNVPGLIQKYDMHDRKTNMMGEVFTFKTENHLNDFVKSELFRNTPNIYKIEGEPEVSKFEIFQELEPVRA